MFAVIFCDNFLQPVYFGMMVVGTSYRAAVGVVYVACEDVCRRGYCMCVCLLQQARRYCLIVFSFEICHGLTVLGYIFCQKRRSFLEVLRKAIRRLGLVLYFELYFTHELIRFESSRGYQIGEKVSRARRLP